MQVNENDLKTSEAILAAHKTYGEDSFGPDGIFDPVIYQGSEGVCAIRSQQIILRDYGIDVSLKELKDYAIQNGWYDTSSEGGTPMWAIGNLLLSCNVPCEQSVDNTIYDLINELGQGHRVIVGVDANELWADREDSLFKGMWEWFKDTVTGEEANHALVVAGVEVNPNNPADVKVILTDPGTGDLRIEYKLDEFMDAWEDSSCFMVSTTVPAPLQYDPTNRCEIPSNFAINEYINTNSIPLNPNNVILPDQMAAMCWGAYGDDGAYYKEGHLDSININDEDIDFDKFSDSVGSIRQQFTSPTGTLKLPGQDHFDKDAFISALKKMIGLGSTDEGPDTGGKTDGSQTSGDSTISGSDGTDGGQTSGDGTISGGDGTDGGQTSGDGTITGGEGTDDSQTFGDGTITGGEGTDGFVMFDF